MKSVLWELNYYIWAEEQADMSKQIVSFHYFANTPLKTYIIPTK